MFIDTIVCVFLLIGFVMFGFFIKSVVTEIRNWMFIKEYRKTDKWNANAPEYLKWMVIPNEEYKG